MKLGFISDIHGNAVALDAVLKDMKEKGVDKFYILGDICFRGPEPKRALELVRSLNSDVIKGNADEWVIRGIRQGEVPTAAFEVMSKERDWIYSNLDEESIEYLKNLPNELHLELGKINIHAFHATPNSLFEVVLPFEKDEVLKQKMMEKEADIYIYAHIHKPFIRYMDGKCLMNIGSVGLPFDGIAKSSYAIVEINDDSFQTSIVRVSYDINKVVKQYNDVNYPNSEQMIKVLEDARI